MAQKDENKPIKAKTPRNKKAPANRKKTTKPDTLKKETEQQRTKTGKIAMIDAMERSLGIVTTASKLCGVSRSQHYEWMQNDPQYMRNINEVAEMAKDFVESQLYDQIKNGSTTATIFYMKCKMRERGYMEKLDVDLNTNRPDLSDMTTEEIRLYLDQKK